MQAEIAGIFRHVLSTAGGSLLMSGVLTQGQIELVSGAIATLLAVGWSVIHKRYVKRYMP